MPPLIDLSGRAFGRWTVLSRGIPPRGVDAQIYWRCRCECGTLRNVHGATLRYGLSRSCGCLRSETTVRLKTTHGLSQAPEHRVWRGIKERCLRPAASNYRHYGGRGIRICPKWQKSFKAFIEDMGRRPTRKHWIERRDNDGHYTPSNCYWALPKEQQNNKRTNVMLTLHGVTRTVSQWANALGFNNSSALYGRIKRGWSLERVLTTRNLTVSR